jgi:hypothetical protein
MDERSSSFADIKFISISCPKDAQALPTTDEKQPGLLYDYDV